MPNISSSDAEVAAAAQSMVASVMFIPAMMALLTRVFTGERMTGRNMYLLINLKGNLKYYGLAWFGVGFLIILGTVLYFIIFRGQFDPDMGYAVAMIQSQAESLGQEVTLTTQQIKATIMQQIILGFVISPFVNIITCFGEEWGWRGYLLPKMLKKFPVVPTLLITGVIWGLWHAPLTVMGHNYGVGYPGFPVVGILAMCVFCTAVGIILSYITIKTKSCVPAILGHGMLNGFASVGSYYTTAESYSAEYSYNVFLGPAPTGIIGGLGFIILAVVLLLKLHKEEKESSQRIEM
jgi:membrane protease YdiL (CAAX protease family)